ncbi:adult cuticle protein 1-like [Toxorhynchites rutilus septentrionalis]|uniref:adult cuticle protein 1-like n=1 Tax=Toxorhynchites rutilus septentrionalis TaxID=329112 RepID=UPI002478ACA3|nr:adult cuticle protein 1-like [Toxorhynchites rutilus septentrionalis]
MKCIAAVVMVAFTAVAHAGYTPLLYSAPWAYTLPHTTVVQSNPETKILAAATPIHTLSYAPPLALTYGAPHYTYSAPIAYDAPAVVLQKEARYLAANRGAIHEAPLPGHAISQQQLNLEPAAGAI